MFSHGTVVKTVLLCASMQFLHSLAIPNDPQKRHGTTTADASNISAHNASERYPEPTEKSMEEVCGSELDGPEDGRRRRSAWISLNESSLNESTATPEKSADYSHLSDSFLNCTHIYLEPECYELLPNESVHVPLYQKVFDRPDYLISEEDRLLYICPDFFRKTEDGEAFADHTWIISMAGATISSICLILHIGVYVAVRTTRNLPGRCLLSLCIALLGAYCSSFLQHAATTPASCLAVGMFMVYFFLASFFWMNVFSYDVWRSMRLATTKLRMTRNRPVMVRFARYSAYAWGAPAAILLLSVIVHHSTTNVKYQLVFDDSICWFKHRQALTLYFAGPLFVLLGVNIVLTVYSFVIISSASIKVKSGGNSSSDSFDLRARFALSIRLCSSMGLMWIFGIIAIVTKQVWLWYLYTICSALQGVFIFFSFTVSERSRRAIRRALNRNKSSVMPTQSSSHPTSSQQTTTI